MLLRVGELARRAGLTVRTLHHYDEIGLLQPSGRSASGYRLYSQADVQRLHAIQTLRHLGLALADIAGLLADGGVNPSASSRSRSVRSTSRLPRPLSCAGAWPCCKAVWRPGPCPTRATGSTPWR